jgi:outer membrane protein TolC
LSGPLHLKTARNWLFRRFPVLFITGAMATLPSLLRAQVSLATVVDLAQRNSSAVKVAEADIRKAQAVLEESKDAYIPSINFSTGLPVFPEVGFTGTPPSIWSATVSSLVFSIPQKRYIDAARSGLEAAMSRLKDAREQVALDASSAYIELDTVNQELAAALQQEEFAGRLVVIERERTEAGVDPLRELLQAQLTGANIKLARVHLESRTALAAKQLAILTGLPVGSITPDHPSIPEIPAVRGDLTPHIMPGVTSARLLARSKQSVARGDREGEYLPQMSFDAQYNRNTTILNSFNSYFNPANPIPANNFSSGIAITVPVLDFGHHAKSHESAAEALRATVEAEQAQNESDVRITEAMGSIRELDTLAEIASLKQQIAGEQLKTVLTELEVGNGGGATPGASPQLSPKAEQLARIDERQKLVDSLDAGFDLAKARLGLLRALGHIEDWLQELRAKP